MYGQITMFLEILRFPCLPRPKTNSVFPFLPYPISRSFFLVTEPFSIRPANISIANIVFTTTAHLCRLYSPILYLAPIDLTLPSHRRFGLIPAGCSLKLSTTRASATPFNLCTTDCVYSPMTSRYSILFIQVSKYRTPISLNNALN